MYLHIGNGKLIKQEQIIGIFDFDTATISKKTKKWLSQKQKENKIEIVTMDIPKSCILMSDEEGKSISFTTITKNTHVKNK